MAFSQIEKGNNLMNIGQIRVVDDATLQCVGWMAEISGKLQKFQSEEKAKNNIKYMMKTYGHAHVEPFPIFRIIPEIE